MSQSPLLHLTASIALHPHVRERTRSKVARATEHCNFRDELSATVFYATMHYKIDHLMFNIMWATRKTKPPKNRSVDGLYRHRDCQAGEPLAANFWL